MIEALLGLVGLSATGAFVWAFVQWRRAEAVGAERQQREVAEMKERAKQMRRRFTHSLLVAGMTLLTGCEGTAAPGFCPQPLVTDDCTKAWLRQPEGRPECVLSWLNRLQKQQEAIRKACPE